MNWILRAQRVRKDFRLHNQGGVRIPVLDGFAFTLDPGESVALAGPSGTGKSTILRLLYGNYRLEDGSVRIRSQGRTVELAGAEPHTILSLRKWTLGYVSQFLRVIPRVAAMDIVCEPLVERGIPMEEARQRASESLTRLRIPQHLWRLSPTTFSGGEQQRINIARAFAVPYPVMLLDEPTASLDAANKATVLDMIRRARQSGTAVLGIYHDKADRRAVADRIVTTGTETGI